MGVHPIRMRIRDVFEYKALYFSRKMFSKNSKNHQNLKIKTPQTQVSIRSLSNEI